MSLVMDATAQSPARRVNSLESLRRNGRSTKRSVVRVTMWERCGRGSSILERARRRSDGAGPTSSRKPRPSRKRAQQPPLLRRILDRRLDGDEDAPAALGGKLHTTLGEGEQRVIGAHANIGAGVHLGAALPHQDVAGQNLLAAVALDAQPAPRGVAAVARGA